MRVLQNDKRLDNLGLQRPITKQRRAQLLLPHTTVRFEKLDSPSRHKLEQFISTCFRGAFDADVHSHLPYYLSAYSHNSMVSTLGFQPVDVNKPVFLEQYLDTNVEQRISEVSKRMISRDKIVEIGSLSSARKGFSELIFILIAAILYEAGYQWVVFTATQQVQQLVAKLRIQTFELCEADPTRLSDKGQSWGRYYETRPKVLSGDLSAGMTSLNQHGAATFMMENYRQTIKHYADQLRELSC